MNSTERSMRLDSGTQRNRPAVSTFDPGLQAAQSSLRRQHLLAASLLLAAPLVFAAVAIALGKEAGWDLQNYHWYNPFAWFNDRLGFDIAVGHHATYYNPLIDAPFYLLAAHAPAWVAGAYIGALYGLAVAVIGAIAYRLIEIAHPYWRLLTAAGLAIAGTLGGGALPAIGSTSNDVPTAIGALLALWIAVNSLPSLQSRIFDRTLALRLLLAGFCAGASIGAKLTTLIYAVGLGMAIFVCASGWRKRFFSGLTFAAGAGSGALLCGGYWMWRMWQYGANPVFPYFNQFFHSPLLIEGSYRDTGFIPTDALTTWLFPWFFTKDSLLVAEWSFRDAHILVAYVLAPATMLFLLARRPARRGPVATRSALFLFSFAASSYLVWLLLFSIYRYLIPLEMLAPLLIAIAILLWPIRRQYQVALIVLVLLAAQLSVNIQIFRQPWDRDYVAVQAPALDDPQHSMVLITGFAPISFVIPAFPSQIPFLRIDGWLVPSDAASGGLARQMRSRVAQHQGPLYALFSPYEDDRALDSVHRYGLAFVDAPCSLVRSNIAEPLKLCRLRQGP